MCEQEFDIDKPKKPKVTDNFFQQTNINKNLDIPKAPEVKSNFNFKTAPTIKSNLSPLGSTSITQKPFKSKYINDSGSGPKRL